VTPAIVPQTPPPPILASGKAKARRAGRAFRCEPLSYLDRGSAMALTSRAASLKWFRGPRKRSRPIIRRRPRSTLASNDGEPANAPRARRAREPVPRACPGYRPQPGRCGALGYHRIRAAFARKQSHERGASSSKSCTWNTTRRVFGSRGGVRSRKRTRRAAASAAKSVAFRPRRLPGSAGFASRCTFPERCHGA